MVYAFIIFAIFLLVLGILLAKFAERGLEKSGLGRVRVVYNDTGSWEKVPRALFSERYGLTGRPDYVVYTKEGLAAVEVKPLRFSDRPYSSDIMQLAAYCLLLEEDWEEQPAYGLLRYANRTFRMEWNSQIKNELLQVLDEMRQLELYPAFLDQTLPEPQHDMTIRCKSCGFKYVCWPETNGLISN